MKKVLALVVSLCMLFCTTAMAEKVSVKLVTWGGGEAYQKSVEEFNARQDEIEFTIEVVSGIEEYLSARMAAGDMPEMYNITPYAGVYDAAAAGRLADLTGIEAAANLLPSTLNPVSVDGKVYAMPYQQQIIGVFYNPVLFEQAGIESVPATYSEMVEVCEKLEAAGIVPFAATYGSSWTLSHVGSCLFYSALRGADREWVKGIAEGEAYADTANVEEVFRFLDLMKKYSGENCMDATSETGFNAFAAGEAAMLVQGDWSLETVNAVDPDMNPGLFAVPVSDDAQYNKLAVDVSVAIAVTEGLSEEKFAAVQEVLKYMYDTSDPTGHNSICFTFMGAGVPSVAYSSEEILAFNYYTDYLSYAESGNVSPWIYQQLPSGTDLGSALQGYMAGLMTAEETLAMLDEANASLAF